MVTIFAIAENPIPGTCNRDIAFQCRLVIGDLSALHSLHVGEDTRPQPPQYRATQGGVSLANGFRCLVFPPYSGLG